MTLLATVMSVVYRSEVRDKKRGGAINQQHIWHYSHWRMVDVVNMTRTMNVDDELWRTSPYSAQRCRKTKPCSSPASQGCPLTRFFSSIH